MVVTFTKEQIDRFGAVLNDTSKPLKARFRALFILRNIGCDLSVKWIANSHDDRLQLLQHETAYCRGQMQNKTAHTKPIVRHEAGEALGAIGDISAREVLEEYVKDLSPSSTLLDPTSTASTDNVTELGATLVDKSKPLWDRYSAMFKLRNINTDASIKALAQGLYCEDSALLRHEVAYVLGQAQSPVAIKELEDRLTLLSSEQCILTHPLNRIVTDYVSLTRHVVIYNIPAVSFHIILFQNCMVRHECAEALGAIATEHCTSLLQNYVSDEEVSFAQHIT
ncbi:PBS lyase HEAT-like repeat protein [Cooperia oncophora]